MTRICYVEDERDIAGVVSEYLEERGFQGHFAPGRRTPGRRWGRRRRTSSSWTGTCRTGTGWLFAAGYVTDGPGFP